MSEREIASANQHEEYKGQTLVTQDHEVIRSWAQERNATPATVASSERDGRPGVLRFDFPGYGGQGLKHVSWDDWFEPFDERKLRFKYQEHMSDGSQSNFFVLENPEREDG